MRLLRRTINATLAIAGLEVRRKPRRSYPYLRHHEAHGVTWDFWIVSDTAAAWYDRDLAADPEFALLAEHVPAGARVLEIGAHHGCMTVFLARRGARVAAVEADPAAALVAHAQCALNRVDALVVPTAVADAAGEASISRIDGRLRREASPDAVTVPVTTADALASAHGPFDVIKVDVEGAEVAVLAAATSILARRPRLALELHGEILGAGGVDALVAALPDGYGGRALLPGGAVVGWPETAPAQRALLLRHPKLNAFLAPG